MSFYEFNLIKTIFILITYKYPSIFTKEGVGVNVGNNTLWISFFALIKTTFSLTIYTCCQDNYPWAFLTLRNVINFTLKRKLISVSCTLNLGRNLIIHLINSWKIASDSNCGNLNFFFQNGTSNVRQFKIFFFETAHLMCGNEISTHSV